MSREDWAAARNVLCVRLDTVGDVLMTTPAIHALKKQRHDRSVTLLTSSVGAEVGRLIPDIDELGLYDPPWMKATDPRGDGDMDRAMIERLRKQHFDAAIIFTVYSQSALAAALLTSLADIPLRLAHCRENPYGLLTDWVPEPEPEHFVRHEVQRHLDLVAFVGVPVRDRRLRIEVSAEAYARVHGALQQLGRGEDLSRPWVVFHPGASAPSRRYPAAAFGQAARMMYEQLGIEPLFTGSEDETQLVEEAFRVAGHGVPLAGRLDLEELAALIGMADLVVTNNTAPAHLAAALATPVVDLYALTNPQDTPWAVPNRVLFSDTDCKYCYRSLCPLGHHKCLEQVSPQEVVEAATELMAEHADTLPTATEPIETDLLASSRQPAQSSLGI